MQLQGSQPANAHIYCGALAAFVSFTKGPGQHHMLQGLDSPAHQQDAELQSALQAAKTGTIPHLKLMALDVLCGTRDAVDRCSSLLGKFQRRPLHL